MKIARTGCRFSLAVVVFSVLLAQSVAAQDLTGYLAPSAGFTGLGSGPLQVSLLGSARMTVPFHGSGPENPVRQNDVAPIGARDLPPSSSPATKPLVADRANLGETNENLAFAR